MKVSALVTFRGDGHRKRVWHFIRDRLARDHPDFEVVLESDDGTDPFHKTLAFNRAARSASGDVYYILDADTWVHPAQVRIGLNMVADGKWGRPYNVKAKLNKLDTLTLLTGAMDIADFRVPHRQALEGQTPYPAAPPMLVPREWYWDVGGFDERFRGWGQEDYAWWLAMREFHGTPMFVVGKALHLWHERIGQSGADLWPGQESQEDNLALVKQYVDARGPVAMRAVIQEAAR